MQYPENMKVLLALFLFEAEAEGWWVGQYRRNFKRRQMLKSLRISALQYSVFGLYLLQLKNK
ncbi:hypothetical protein IEQ34_021049 [Dendrobium chrysotoxum]|uniref:Uncharacterized protein n=1 Tax=Dendrobium chrysotoxum TaxID=161865 RepID=A0AAV7G2E0_DENCH|nr:hypothetical protein IEQ34_021049 [Dendrobium chrysotoxum]